MPLDAYTLTDFAVDFDALPAERLREMLAAGEEAVDCIRVLAKTGDNIVGELLKTEENFYEWDHYPAGDVYDHETHAQYYYHAHPQELRSGEHGHFHTFMRSGALPPDIRPAALPDYDTPADANDDLCHLVAISMDPHGLPIRLFATNRWVTGETWYAAPDVVRMIDMFDIDHAQPSWPVNRWITAMMKLFRPQVVALAEARDRRVAEWAARHPGGNAYEDRDLEIAAALDVSIDEQVSAVRDALARKA